MNIQQITGFSVIGIAVRTTNENGQAARDIPALWRQFMTEGTAAKIPGKTEGTVYCIYTDYEKDYTRPYTTILGCRVNSLDDIPAGMTGINIHTGAYCKYTAAGNLTQGVVFDTWTRIWHSDVPRTYTTDFEVYDEKAAHPENAEVAIFIAVHQ